MNSLVQFGTRDQGPGTRGWASISDISNRFLGKPYQTGAQDQDLYNLKSFDCVTYVNSVLALYRSNNEREFQQQLLQLNYYDADPLFEKRFHFMSVDWNLQNQQNNVVRDITETFSGVKFASGDIDKPNWFLKQTGKIPAGCQKVFARIPYLPIQQALNNLDKIPHESIVEIVRPNWDLREKIGTQLHVSHVGFAIREKNNLLFRHASSEAKCVTDIKLSDYLKHTLQSETIKGIHIQKIL